MRDKRLSRRPDARGTEVHRDHDASRQVRELRWHGEDWRFRESQGVDRRFATEDAIEQVMMAEAEHDHARIEFAGSARDGRRRIAFPDLDLPPCSP